MKHLKKSFIPLISFFVVLFVMLPSEAIGASRTTLPGKYKNQISSVSSKSFSSYKRSFGKSSSAISIKSKASTKTINTSSSSSKQSSSKSSFISINFDSIYDLMSQTNTLMQETDFRSFNLIFGKTNKSVLRLQELQNLYALQVNSIAIYNQKAKQMNIKIEDFSDIKRIQDLAKSLSDEYFDIITRLRDSLK